VSNPGSWCSVPGELAAREVEIGTGVMVRHGPFTLCAPRRRVNAVRGSSRDGSSVARTLANCDAN
jgi:hypothetical protein